MGNLDHKQRLRQAVPGLATVPWRRAKVVGWRPEPATLPAFVAWVVAMAGLGKPGLRYQVQVGSGWFMLVQFEP